jgi:hypothetical protein
MFILGIGITLVVMVALAVFVFLAIREDEKVEEKQVQVVEDVHAYVVSEIERRMPKMTHPNWAWAIKTETAKGKRHVTVSARNIITDEEKVVSSSLTECIRHKKYIKDDEWLDITTIEYTNGDPKETKRVVDDVSVGQVIKRCNAYLVNNRPDADDEPTYKIL